MTTISLFKEASDLETIAAGQTIFEEGRYDDKMYVIVAGEVEITLAGKVIATLGEGEPLGEMALVEGTSHSATAIAKTECKLAPINQHRFNFLVENHPFFARQMMSVMSERVRTLTAAKA